VPETRTVIICSHCRAFWDPAAEQAACTDTSHEHLRFDSHLHRSRVALRDGTEVTAVSFGSADPYGRDVSPDFGLYLDERWRPPWPHDHLGWPDFGVPDDPALVVDVLEQFLHRARAGQRVEIGCYGGHGRTGTALACLAILCGQAPDEAVGWVRATYCKRAVETEEQEAFVRNLIP
jgi:Protein-tyrosine phosphatase